MSQDTDNNFWQIPESNRDYEGICADPRQTGHSPAAFDDLIKGSGKRNVTVRNFTAEAGGQHFEDGIDLNSECQSIAFEDGRIGAGKKGVAVTIKGGSCDTLLRRCFISQPGRYCDIEIGNWSDQSWRSCEGTVIEDCMRLDGQPVRVAWGRGSRPTITGGNVRIVWWWTIVLHLYVYGKRSLIFLF